jgi:nucleotide-binding universal stress UspA family protein
MIKDIIVNLEHRAPHDPACDYAISIAQAFNAHTTGVAFAYEPDLPGHVMAEFPSDILAQLRAKSGEAVRAVIDRFEDAAKRSLLSAEHRLHQVTEAGASVLFSTLARRFDLSVLLQTEPGSVNNDDMIEASLFESGRPVCAIPYIQREGIKLDRLVCCWDGSRPAARAINDALPFLTRAGAVDLVIVLNEKTKNDDREIRGVEMGKHLARHGIKVEVKTMVAPDIDVTNTILSYVADSSATMIVMGAYGHSRLREFLLGGVTRGILSSMTVPVLMSH